MKFVAKCFWMTHLKVIQNPVYNFTNFLTHHTASSRTCTAHTFLNFIQYGGEAKGLLILKEQSAAAFINNSIYKLWVVFTTYNEAIISFTHFCDPKKRKFVWKHKTAIENKISIILLLFVVSNFGINERLFWSLLVKGVYRTWEPFNFY